MTGRTVETIECSMKEIEALLEEARASLDAGAFAKLEKLVRAYLTLTELIEDKQTTIRYLRKLLGFQSEKTRNVLERAGLEDKAKPSAGGGEGEEGGEKNRKRPKGHGRNGADAYPGAKQVKVPHGSLESGAACPNAGCAGTVYEEKTPGVIVRVEGQPPLAATVYELQKLRCNLCGEVFTATPPAGVGEAKYDATAAAMIGLLRYGSGLPFNRLERLQRNFGVPLPDATQWDIVRGASETLWPVYEALLLEAAQGEVLFNDDTGTKILELMGEGRTEALARASLDDATSARASARTGVFTSGIVSTRGGRKIAVFFTGWEHAGENLGKVLAKRAAALGPPIQMCDALSRNLPHGLAVIVANCLAHGRRHFVDLVEIFPEACRHVLEQLGTVYAADATAREKNLSPEERLRFHQEESGPVMDQLHAWFQAQFAEKKVEPNSRLGSAIAYMQNHWSKLTLFLREPGAPLDNTTCERALKKAILHRRNSLFYKTQNGALVGDLFMSLVYTAELGEVNAFDYLTALLRHPDALALAPGEWLPWNYPAALAKASSE